MVFKVHRELLHWNNNPGTWDTVGGEASYCGSCHDETPGNSKKDGTGDTAPNIVGDNTTYGYFVTGHGKTTGSYARLSWQATMAYGNSAANKQCSACHDLTSQHYNSANKRLKPGYENDSSNSNCKQCHDPGTVAISDPEWYTTYAEYQNSAHKSKKCSECHDVHGASGTYTGMTKGDKQNLCYQCHKDPASGGIQNNAISGASLANNIQQAFSLTNKHDLGTSFSVNFESYTLECVSCHNVHIVTGKYWDAASNKSPITRFTNNTSVWGNNSGEKMKDYASNGIYQTPTWDTSIGADFRGSVMPDYPSFCLDCHGDPNAPGMGPIDWNGNPHGKGVAYGADNGYDTYPDYWSNGPGGTESITPGFVAKRGRGNLDFTKAPYDMERRMAGGNFTLSCTNCHEAHGSNAGSMIRPSGAGCRTCHFIGSPAMGGGLMGCDSASCHWSGNIHRANAIWSGGGAATVFDREHSLDLRFESVGDQSGGAYFEDASTWLGHARFLDMGLDPGGICQNGSYSFGTCNWQASVAAVQAKLTPGKAGNAVQLDGDDCIEPGTRTCCMSSTSSGFNTASLWEALDKMTIETWIYPTELPTYPSGAGNYRKVIASNEKEGSYNFAIELLADGTERTNTGGNTWLVGPTRFTDPRIVFRIHPLLSLGSKSAYSSVPVQANQWYHLAVVYDAYARDGKLIKIYLNGKDVTANTSTGDYYEPFGQPAAGTLIHPASYYNYYNKQEFMIGCDPSIINNETIGVENWSGFKGKIDEFNFYNVVRTPRQIEQDYGGARMLSAVGDIGSNQIMVTFSEGVYTNAGASGALAPSDFTLADTDNGRTIISVSHTAGTSTATLTLSSALDPSNDIDVDTLAAASETSIYDADSIAMSTRAVIITNMPEIKSAIARDVGGAAGIQAGDRVIIKFNAATQGNAINASNINSALALNNGNSWLDGSGNIGSAQWSTTTFSNDTLTITLSATGGIPTVMPGDIISPNGTIKNSGGASLTDPHVISGTFDPLLDGAVGYWNFVENTGLTAYDSTTNENHGTFTNGVTWTTGPTDSAAGLDGDDDYVEIPDSNSLDLTDQGALEVWAKKNADHTYQTLVGKYSMAGGPLTRFGYALMDNNGYIGLRWGDPAAVTGTSDGTVTLYEALTDDVEKVETGTWNHILATYDGAQIKIFINGRLSKTGTYTKAATANTYPLRIGASGSGEGAFDNLYDGDIDEVAVYNRALTNDEARERYGLPIKPKSAIAYDVEGADGLEAGDRLIIKFDGPTNGAAINSANINTVFALSNSHTWGQLSSAVWNTNVFTNDTLTIILNTGATIAPADIITLNGISLTDRQGNAITATQVVAGTFNPLPSGAVGYWNFIEGTGSVAYDATLYENHGDIKGGITWQTAGNKKDTAINLNGTNGYVRVWDFSNSLDLTTDGALEAWVKKDTEKYYQVYFGKGEKRGSMDYLLYDENPTGAPMLYVGDSYAEQDWTYPVPTAEWSHVVATWGNNTAAIYINGELVNSTTGLSAPVIGNAPFQIGYNWVGYDYSWSTYFDGAMDEVIVYNRALPSDEVRVRSGFPIIMKTAVAYDVNDAAGIQAGDKVVIAFNGPTQGNAITTANINSALNLDGHSWLDGSGAVGSIRWTSNKYTNDILTIILTNSISAPTVNAGDIITLNGTTLKDNMGRPIGSLTMDPPVPPASVAISGTFSALSGDIVGYWNFAEGSGSSANDSSIYKNNGTLKNSASWTAGQSDGALSLNGTDGYVRVQDSNSLDLATRDIYGVKQITVSEYLGGAVTGYAEGFAVGQSGAILHKSKQGMDLSWRQVASPVTEPLYAVDMVSRQQPTTVGTPPDTSTVNLTVIDQGWAVGHAGVMLKYDSSNWTAVAGPTTANLFGVDLLSTTDGWAVGASNTILRYNGSTWTPVSITSPSKTWTIKAVRMVSSSDGWAVGGDNVNTSVILRYNGTSWTEFATTTATNMLNAVDMLSSTSGWAVGNYGTILRFDGAAWTAEASPTTQDLYAVGMYSLTGITTHYTDDGTPYTVTYTYNDSYAAGAGKTLIKYGCDTTADPSCTPAWANHPYTYEITGSPTFRAIDFVPYDASWGNTWEAGQGLMGGDANSLLRHQIGIQSWATVPNKAWIGETVPEFLNATFEIWAKKNANTDSQTYLSKEYQGSANAPIYYRIKDYGSTGKVAFTWNAYTYGESMGMVVSDDILPAGQWNHIVAVLDGNDSRLYLNGQLSGTMTRASTSNQAYSYEPLLIGSNGTTGGAKFNGDIDQVTIYNRTLSGDEILAKFNPNAVTGLMSATANEMGSRAAGIQPGDQVIIKFNGPTAGTPVTAANINSVLSLGGHTWLDGAGAVSSVWSATAFTKDTLTITLSTTLDSPTVAEGDTITLGGGLLDSKGQPLSGSIVISGSFGTDLYSWSLDTYSEWKAGTLNYTSPVGECLELQRWEKTTEQINSIDMLSATEGWAVGNNGTIRKYDGTGWKGAYQPVTTKLNFVDMLSSTDGMAVGDSMGVNDLGVILRYDGASWSTMTTPALGITANLYGVKMLSATEAWAVGSSGRIFKYDGTSWILFATPTTYDLYAIDMLSSTQGVATSFGGKIFRFDGTAWTEDTTAPYTGKHYYSVQIRSANEIWIAGGSSTGASTILKYDGASWATMTLPSSPTYYDLYSIRMTSSTDGWAVGGSNISGNLNSVILRWDGTSWSNYATYTDFNTLKSVAMVSSTDGWTGAYKKVSQEKILLL